MPIYRDIYDGPPRSYIAERTAKRWIVIHCTQNDATAEGEAAYAKRRGDGISSHYYVDADSIVQSLDTDLGAHHVGSSTGNRGGVSYELTGFAAWSRPRWLANLAWPLLAAAVARDCVHHGIAVRELTVRQIRDGATGVITHNQARLAWGHTSHTDPGPGFPMDHLTDQVRAVMGDDVMPTADEVADAVLSRRFRDYLTGESSQVSHQLYSARRDAAVARKLVEAQAQAGRALTAAEVQQIVRGEVDEVAAALEQAAAQRAEILAAVQAVQSGEREAAEVVDEIARRLAAAAEPARDES